MRHGENAGDILRHDNKREDIMSELWREMEGVSFEVCEISASPETFYQQHNPFGMSFLEQQDVILRTLMSFQENDAR